MNNIKRKIAILTASRSEAGLLDPIIRSAVRHEGLDTSLIKLNPHATASEFIIDLLGKYLDEGPFDLVLIPTDRVEMALAAMATYYHGFPIVHYLGGSSFTGTWDDLNRRVISSYAYYIFCEDTNAAMRLKNTGEEDWRIVVTGTTHFDGLVIDESECPKGVYDLVLVNPNPIDRGDTIKSVVQALEAITETGNFVWIEPNEDLGREMIRVAGIDMLSFPRPKFLGLLKNCRKFITNSSAGKYEAPFFEKEVIWVGNRNRERAVQQHTTYSQLQYRPEPTWNYKVSTRIVSLLATLAIDKSMMLKRYYDRV